MFQEFNEEVTLSTPQNNDGYDEDIIGTVDLSHPENLDVDTASIELTTRNPLHNTLSPVSTSSINRDHELSLEEWNKTIDRLRYIGITDVTITGGDPTIRRNDFRPILQKAIRSFDNVTVQISGATNQPLSDFDCTVSVPLDYVLPPEYNNQLHRVTNPDLYDYDINNGELIPLEDDVEDKPYKVEQATRMAMYRAERLDNPIVIRSHILNNNNLKPIIAYAQMIKADVVFRPIYPVDVPASLYEQIPAPRRMYEAMQFVQRRNAQIQENTYTVNCPMYKAWQQETAFDQGVIAPRKGTEMIEWYKRGRVSDIGVSRLHVGADGTVHPSRYIRQNKYQLGHILKVDKHQLYSNMAQFNDKITEQDDFKPATTFQITQRSLITDYNMVLNNKY